MAIRPIPVGDASERRARTLERLLVTKANILRAQALRNARSPDAADDAFQEGCVEFLRYYNGESDDHAIAWLMLAIRHRAWTDVRRDRERKARGEFSLGAAVGCDAALPDRTCERLGPAEFVERGEEASRFFAALFRLPAAQRTALLLLGFGYSYAEIMDRHSWSYRKVSRCLSDGRAALRGR